MSNANAAAPSPASQSTIVRTTTDGPDHPELLSPALDLTDPGSLGRLGNYRRLAAAIGMNRSHVSRVLRGKTGVNTDVARKLAGALGITVDALIAHRDAVAKIPAEERCRCGHHVSAHGVTRTPATVAGEELVMVTRGECEVCTCARFEVAKRRGRVDEPSSEETQP